MITPIVRESEWRNLLEDLPAWEPPLVHTLVLSPHPDDETLGAGGLIAYLRSRDTRVTVVALTDGEGAYDETPNLAATREREQTEALACLGVLPHEIIRLRLPDTQVSKWQAALEEKLLGLLGEGMHLIAPWQHDFHPDHEACGRAASVAARERIVPLTFYFFWTWHRGTASALDGLNLVTLPLSKPELQSRHAALLCHQSQLRHPIAPILPSNLLGPMKRHFEVFLPA